MSFEVQNLWFAGGIGELARHFAAVLDGVHFHDQERIAPSHFNTGADFRGLEGGKELHDLAIQREFDQTPSVRIEIGNRRAFCRDRALQSHAGIGGELADERHDHARHAEVEKQRADHGGYRQPFVGEVRAEQKRAHSRARTVTEDVEGRERNNVSKAELRALCLAMALSLSVRGSNSVRMADARVPDGRVSVAGGEVPGVSCVGVRTDMHKPQKRHADDSKDANR